MDLFRFLINERQSELCPIDHNSEEVHNLQYPDEEKNFGSTILIGRDIWCPRMREFF